MADIDIDIRGIAETQRAIYQFSEKLGDRVTLLALRSGANFMLKKVREAEPVKTGRMKRATVVANSRIHRRRKDGVVGVYITVRPGRSRNDPKGAFYAKFVEHGHKRGSKQIPGKKFVTNTFTASKAEALDIIIGALETGGQRLAQDIQTR